MAMIAEGLTPGVKAGADPAAMSQVIGVISGNSTLFQIRANDFLLKDQYAPGFMLDLMKKDIGIGVDLGKAMDIPVPSTLGHGRDDFSAVSKADGEADGSEFRGMRESANT
jgi:3-hydroxyisobutyrate dehydrogenase-like beta-hydroxyacid dehydrogenase